MRSRVNKKNYKAYMTKKGKKRIPMRKRILELILRMGIIPYSALRIIGLRVSRAWFQQTLNIMKKEGIIKISSSEETGRYAMLESYSRDKEMLAEHVSERQLRFFEENYSNDLKNRAKDRHSRRIRLKRSAEIQALMWVLRIPSRPKKDCESEYTPSKVLKQITDYKDMVKQNVHGSSSLYVSRLLGLLRYDHQYYAIYHMGDTVDLWKESGESRMKPHLGEYATKREGVNVVVNDAVVFTDDYCILECILGIRPPKKRTTHNFEDVYDNGTYLLPYDIDGLHMLSIMCLKNWKSRLKTIILEGAHENNASNDKVEETSSFVFCVSNIKEIRGAIAASKRIDDRSRFKVYCFEFQKESVAILFGDEVRIFVIGLDDCLSELGLKIYKPIAGKDRSKRFKNKDKEVD